ncbi:DUF2213 domain-containing protein [Neoroseomonas lacus]|nr:DUF2213 domain-containing protein [Neoroseomonas lacus]
MIRDMSTGWRASPVRLAPPRAQREDRGGCAGEGQRFDFVSLESAQVTPEGWIMDSPIVSRSGVFAYTQLDGTVRREYRPPEEVFSAEALRSMRGVPVTDGHRGRVTKDAYTHAIIGTVMSEGRRDGEGVVADVVIHAPNRIGTKRELSLGYAVEMDMTPGLTPDGQHYDAIQRNIRINTSLWSSGAARALRGCGSMAVIRGPSRVPRATCARASTAGSRSASPRATPGGTWSARCATTAWAASARTASTSGRTRSRCRREG